MKAPGTRHRVVGLVSGGKDSIFALYECVRQGHEILAIANLHPPEEDVEEMDSYMYQTVGWKVVRDALPLCLGVPLVRRTTSAKAVQQTLAYNHEEDVADSVNAENEVEDLFVLLKEAKDRFPDLTAVSCGAVLSDYQRYRVESVCSRLNLVCLAYLWQRDQTALLQDMMEADVDAILVKIAVMGLKTNHLGQSISALFPHFQKLNEQFDFHVAGEGGEYESLTLDCPLFRRRIVVDGYERKVVSNDPFAPVAYLTNIQFHLEEKDKSLENPTVSSEAVATADLQPAESNLSRDDNKQEEEIEVKTSVLHNKERGLFHVVGYPMCISRDSGHKQLRHSSKQSVMEKVFSAMSEILHLRHSADLKNCSFFVRVYLENMADFSLLNSVYKRHFSIFQPAARECVGWGATLRDLATAGVLVVEAMVADSRDEFRTLHVQSISKWAPACIGPYSQAVILKGSRDIMLAGNIGLDPGSMMLVDKQDQLDRTLQSVRNVMDVVGAGSPLSSVLYTRTCVPRSEEYLSAIRTAFAEYLYPVDTDTYQNEQIAPILLVGVEDLPRVADLEIQVCCGFAREEVSTSALVQGNARLYENRSSTSSIFKLIAFSNLAELDSVPLYGDDGSRGEVWYMRVFYVPTDIERSALLEYMNRTYATGIDNMMVVLPTRSIHILSATKEQSQNYSVSGCIQIFFSSPQEREKEDTD